MQVSYDNYVINQELYKSFKEPLFLKPDGVRTRYPIGWNGYGRYMPGSLKVKYNGTYADITEEDNGIWYSFNTPPSASDSYEDFTVSYVVRPLDYAFSVGDELGGYKDEEYFLFPNWNNAKGEKNGFWIGKYMASNKGGNIPQSHKTAGRWGYISRVNAIQYSKNKGEGWHLTRNRQWVSIALWVEHIGFDFSTFTINSHNNTDLGIFEMRGDAGWNIVDGIENRNGEIYVFNNTNTDYEDLRISTIGNPGTLALSIRNETQDILNEGVINTKDNSGFIPKNLENSAGFFNSNATCVVYRAGSYSDSRASNGIWSFNNDNQETASYGHVGFRISREVM